MAGARLCGSSKYLAERRLQPKPLFPSGRTPKNADECEAGIDTFHTLMRGFEISLDVSQPIWEYACIASAEKADDSISTVA